MDRDEHRGYRPDTARPMVPIKSYAQTFDDDQGGYLVQLHADSGLIARWRVTDSHVAENLKRMLNHSGVHLVK